MKRVMILTGLVLASATSAYAQSTETQARAMLDRAVASVKSDKAAALERMRKGEGGSVDRDLYVFCADASQGILTVHPFLLGRQIKNIIDKNGKTLGADMMRDARDGIVDTIRYLWSRPGGDTPPVEKISFFTRVADQVCGVGYYK